jgi:uncharacterized membrane protein
MNSGMWFIIVIPAAIVFIFCLWVIISIVADVSNRSRQLELRETVDHAVIVKSTKPSY